MYSATVRGPENLRYSILEVEVLIKFLIRSTYEIVHISVADLDPEDPYFGPLGSGSVSIRQK
jgi:hypothetical protein